MERYFFEIPIYRCAPEKYLAETNEMHEKINRSFDGHRETFPNYDYSHLIQARFLRQYNPYEYNEVIGWIRLYILGTQIRGRYYFESDPKNPEFYKKRIDKGIRKKRFIDCDKAFDISIYKEQTSSAIFTVLLEELERLTKHEVPFKNRYLDLEQLNNIGKYVDWRMLINDLGF